jgi:hypothetical protein
MIGNKEMLKNATNKSKKITALIQDGFIAFTGAGISFSYPSSIPTSETIKRIIWQELDSHLIDDQDLRTRINNRINFLLPQIKLETMFEVFLRRGVTDIFDSLLVFNQSNPNLDHYLFGLLCKLGYLRAIFTLNFDRLHEKALEAFHLPYTSFLKDVDYKPETKISECIGTPVFHLHNGFLPDDNETSHLNAATSLVRTNLPYEKASIFASYLKKYPILCAGYSNNDLDTFNYISKYSKKILWYSHYSEDIEPLPPDVTVVKNVLGGNFIQIIRGEQYHNEQTFNDVLINRIPELQIYKKNLIALVNPFGINSLEDKEKIIREKIHEKIRSSVHAIILIADLLDLITERELALELIKKYDLLRLNLDNELVESTASILTHIYDRMGQPKLALKYSKLSIVRASGDEKLANMINYASALLGAWKKEAYRVHYLFRYLFLRNKINAEFEEKSALLPIDLINRWYFEKGDFYDFLSGYFFFPSILFLRLKIRKISDFNKENLTRYFSNKLLKILDLFMINILGNLIKYWQNKAIFYYSQVLKDEESTRGYFYLCMCRIIEILCFQSRMTEAEGYIPILKRGLSYFDFSNEKHGKGNIYLALYCYLSRKNSQEPTIHSDVYLSKARESYGTHFSGLFKSNILEFRVKNKIFLPNNK